MPKPLFKQNDIKAKTRNTLSLTPKNEQKLSLNEKHLLEQKLRHKRSTNYLKKLVDLDIGGHTCNESRIAEIVKTISEEFPDISLGENYIGYICKCELGMPYEVHILDIYGNTIKSGFNDMNLETVTVFQSSTMATDLDTLIPIDRINPNSIISRTGKIKHYKKGETLPEGLEPARSLIVNGGYELVEIYSDCFRAISKEGNVSVISRH